MKSINRAFLLGNPIRIIQNLWHYREMIGQMIVRDFGQRYRGSYLGVIWAILNPLLLLLIYTFVFSVVFKARWNPSEVNSPPGEFAIVLFAGLIPYYFFSEVLGRAPGIVLNNPNYVKKVVFPLEVLLVVISGTALISSMIQLGILIIAMLVILHSIPATILLLPLIYLPLILITLGFAWFLASLGVFIRDIALVISLILQVLLFLSPIFYSITAVPERFQQILRLNPLTMIVTNFRNLILWGEMFPVGEWAVWLVISIMVAIFGYLWFMWTKKGFADVL